MPQSYNLHGYQPLAINERCLTDEDRKEAFDEALHGIACGKGGGDWRDYATSEELARLEREVDRVAQGHVAVNYIDRRNDRT